MNPWNFKICLAANTTGTCIISNFVTFFCKVMAIGDGENDIEMLQLASLGVALANGAEKTKAVANVIGATNDEDGVAQAIYDYAF